MTKDNQRSDKDQALRQQLVSLLRGGEAHAKFAGVIKSFPAKLRGVTPDKMPHSAWMLLEHIRIAQWDILEFSRNAKHVSPEFPSGYWPSTPAPPNEKAWDKSADTFRSDLKTMAELVANESTDLFTPIPHGEGKTILREALLVADHNAYHLGELVLLRRLLGAWQ